MRADHSARPGSTLVEVLVGLVILAVAGSGLIVLIGQTSHTMNRTFVAERRLRQASAELSRFAALDRAAMAARVGTSQSHGWSVSVMVASTSLFDVSVAPTDTSAVWLRTTFYRPDTTDTAHVDR